MVQAARGRAPQPVVALLHGAGRPRRRPGVPQL